MCPCVVGSIVVIVLCFAGGAYAQAPPDATETRSPAAESPAPASSPPSAAPAIPARAPDSARTSRIQGSATLGRNRPIAGATVVVANESAGHLFYLTSTDAKGTFRVDGLAEGTYGVGFSRDGLAPVTKSGIVVKPPFRGIVEVTMAPAGAASAAPPKPAEQEPAGTPLRLAGVALDSESRSLADVRIRMVRASGPADPREALTGADGSFSVAELAPGRWVVESLGLAFLPLRAELHLTGDSTVQLVLVGQPSGYQAPPLDLVPREEPIPPAEGS